MLNFRQGALCGSLCLFGLGIGCARELPGQTPPNSAFYFPVGLASSGDFGDGAGEYIYVVNSNFDQRYKSGWLTVVDMNALLAGIDAGETGDSLTAAIVDELQVPSLGGQLSVAPQGDLGLLTGRGGQPMTVIEISGGIDLSCGDPASVADLNTALARTDCDRAHLIDVTPNVVKGAFPGTPLDVKEAAVADAFSAHFVNVPASDGVSEVLYAVVSYLSSTLVSVWEVDRAGDSLLRADRTLLLTSSGSRGIGALAVHPNRSVAGTVFVAAANRFQGNSTVYSMGLRRTLDGEQEIDASRVLSAHSIGSEVGGLDVLDFAFNPSGDRAYALNRGPESVVILDTSLESVQVRSGGVNFYEQRPMYRPIGALSLRGRPSALVYLPRTEGPDLLAVSSFADDAVFILSVQGETFQVEQRIDRVGLGPYDIIAVQRAGRSFLLVSTFFDHGLAVIDVSSSAPENFRRIAHVQSARTEEFVGRREP
ncbi:MAG: hypothetical protein R3C68_02710 [Myxococcota bacterium]